MKHLLCGHVVIINDLYQILIASVNSYINCNSDICDIHDIHTPLINVVLD